jgi:hypothetical protein
MDIMGVMSRARSYICAAEDTQRMLALRDDSRGLQYQEPPS